MYNNGEIPKRLENVKKFEGYLNFKFCVAGLISNARIKPRMVTAKAVCFRYCYLWDCHWRNFAGGNESSKDTYS